VASLDMRSLARAGAVVRLDELRAEMASLKAAFPDVSAARETASPKTQGTARPGRKPGRKRGSSMNAAQRAAVSARMKRYWAGRRAAKRGAAKKRTMSPAARRKIAAAQKKRWAAIKAKAVE